MDNWSYNKKNGDCGFTVIEVVLSMGIIAIVAVTVLGVLSVLLDTSRDSWQDSRSAFIARQIMTDLTSGTGSNGLLQKVANATPNPTPVLVPLSGTAPYTDQVYYNADAVAVPQNDPSMIFEADIELVEVDPMHRPGFKKMQISIHPFKQSKNRIPYLFISRMAPRTTGTNN